MTTLETYIDLVAAGIPSNSKIAKTILDASTDETQIDSVFDTFNQVSYLLGQASTGQISWETSTTVSKGFPVLFAMQGSQGGNNVASITSIPLEDVINGSKSPETFQQNGEKMYLVGMATLIIEVSSNVVYNVNMKIGVNSSEVDPSNFSTIDWDSTFYPVIYAIATKLNELYLPPNVLAPTPIPFIPQPILYIASSLSNAVTAALAIIHVGEAIITGISHQSAFRSLIINSTSEDITISDTYYKNQGLLNCSNTSGQSLDGLKNAVIPAKIHVKIDDESNYDLLQFIMLYQISETDYKGTGMAITSIVGNQENVAASINIPWTSNNNINCQCPNDKTAEDYWEDSHTTSSTTVATTVISESQNFNMSIDYLDGKHPNDSGVEGYFYNTILAFSYEEE